MSDAVTLSLVERPTHALIADCIAADQFAGLDAKEIAELPVVHGGRQAKLGDFFKVRGGHSSVVRIEGDVPHVEAIGAGMTGGELTIDGSVGRDLGLAMSGGRIDVRGHAGDNAGGARPGAARGMTGGEIIVRGNAGDEAGARMRRGLVVVTGNAGRGTGQGMIAGTLPEAWLDRRARADRSAGHVPLRLHLPPTARRVAAPLPARPPRRASRRSLRRRQVRAVFG